MVKHPSEIELNCSNVCCAECIICSRPHGAGNKPFMEKDVFEMLVTQLQDINFKIIQTSGNGEAFLNPHYLDYIETLKTKFPHIPRWTYNNFSLLNRERADRIVEQDLFSKIHVRIDSLHKWIFEKNSNLNQNIVFNNLKYFLSINKKIPVVILYNNINDYYNKCKKVLDKRPIRDFFTDEELKQIPREEAEIKEYFSWYSPLGTLAPTVCTIGHSLWGERLKASQNIKASCPKWNVIQNVIWVSPDGSVIVCCYDDYQSKFICGNIMEEHLLDIFNGEKRKEILEGIKNRKYIDYPCVNPVCCGFGDGGTESK